MKNFLSVILLISIFILTYTKAQAQSTGNPIQFIDRNLISLVSNDSQVSRMATIKLVIEEDVLKLHLDTLNLGISPSSSIGRKTILMSLPIQLPPSKRLVLSSLSEIGNALIRKKGGSTALTSEVIFAGSPGIAVSHKGKALGASIINLSNKKIIKSHCGASVNLRINKSIRSREAKISSFRSSIVLSLEDC